MVACEVDGCDNPVYSKRLCVTDYNRSWRANRPTCIIQFCEAPGACPGYLCTSHYKRKLRYGDPLGTSPRTGPDNERVWQFVDRRAGGCWLWTGSVNRNGYGSFNILDGRGRSERTTARAHRFIYELLVEPIPEGLELDHLCNNRRCVYPVHLEPVTRSENVRRAISRRAPTGVHCPTCCCGTH